GSLLLTVGSHLDKDKRENLTYYGQELNTATYNLTRMNLILHGVRPAKMKIRNANTLAEDWPEDPSKPGEGVQFDAVVMNPPYSVKRWNKNDLKVSDPRFEVAGVLPPDSKGDYAFLLHGLYHLGQQGAMAIVLPHGVLFRGGSEGEIRRSLIERNYIDTIIGLPSNLFSNTGIPVTVLILKKNRKLGEPVLVIDASKEFIKVGKQNVLQEKDIARIVDTYSGRLELEGYSHLASLKEIKENDFNMNIPRYVEQIEKDLPHDVDGHLYGGIPEDNIRSLKLLNTYAKNSLDQALEELRPGYKRLKVSKEEFTNLILSNPNIQKKTARLSKDLSSYTDSYLNKLKTIDSIERVKALREEMMEELRKLLENYDYVDLYDGYQMIARLWNESLNEDTELIAEGNFYEIARQRLPNMVTKGTGKNKREEQDGFVGALIPNLLIKEILYKEEIKELENLSILLSETESELNEVIEAAKVEGSDEYEALNDCLKRDSEGEPGNSFIKGDLNKELKETDKDDDNYLHIKRAIELMDSRTDYNREKNNKTKELDSLVEDRILNLTNKEIDYLIELKWFKEIKTEITSLITDPVKEEIDTLIELNERYSQTLEDLDREIEALEKDFQSLLSELVVTK
ncbi:MAG: type I restriction-modification system subunit M, partial [Synergistaceae bacterium]|nr:type I restriction-modification system subunit M [Synergistaceae bacterium]